jgi:hypothetical protein
MLVGESRYHACWEILYEVVSQKYEVLKPATRGGIRSREYRKVCLQMFEG